MKRDLLDRKLQEMPTAELSDVEKDRMHDSLVKQTSHFKQRNSIKQTTNFIMSAVGAAAVIMLAVVLFAFPSNEQTPLHAFVAEEEIKSLEEELLSYDRYILLPTYIPFEVDEVKLDKTYWGPKAIGDREIIYTEEDEPSHWTLHLQYLSNENPKRALAIEMSNKYELTEDDLAYMDEIVQFSNERIGGYTVFTDFSTAFEGNGATQRFAWQENGTIFNVDVSFEDGELLSKEEFLKIIESLQPLNPDFVPKPKEEEQIYFTFDEVVYEHIAINEITSLNLTRGSDISKVFLTDENLINEVMSTFKGLQLEKVEHIPFESHDLRSDSFYVEVNKNSRFYVNIYEDGYIRISDGEALNIPYGEYKILNEYMYFKVIDTLPIEWK